VSVVNCIFVSLGLQNAQYERGRRRKNVEDVKQEKQGDNNYIIVNSFLNFNYVFENV